MAGPDLFLQWLLHQLWSAILFSLPFSLPLYFSLLFSFIFFPIQVTSLVSHSSTPGQANPVVLFDVHLFSLWFVHRYGLKGDWKLPLFHRIYTDHPCLPGSFGGYLGSFIRRLVLSLTTLLK